MSVFSGKCDLFDLISMMKHRTKDGSDEKEDLEKASVLYSDELECFEIFKQRTNGVIHQHKVMEVTPYNYSEVAELTKGQFEAIPHTKTVPDKRQKSGERTDTYYTYKYWGKEYLSLKELNKRKVYITIDIRFDTILDLIPYYPYIVSSSCSNDEELTVYVSNESYVDEERDDRLKRGWYSDYWQDYKKALQNHYREVVLRYFNPEGRERCELVKFDENGLGRVSHPIDYNHEVEWHWEDGKPKPHWTSPLVIDYREGTIKMHECDLKFLGDSMFVSYVEDAPSELFLC